MTQMEQMTTDKKGLRHCMHTPLYRAATAKDRHPALDAGPKREKGWFRSRIKCGMTAADAGWPCLAAQHDHTNKKHSPVLQSAPVD